MTEKSTILTKILKCPVCSSDVYVSENGKSLYCRGERRHCFDFSSEGYLNLSRQGMGDTKASVNARRSFLSNGYYFPVAHEICRISRKYSGDNGVIIDAGCGEGYYTSMLSKNAAFVLGCDLSKAGISAAAKSAKHDGANNLLYTVASVFELPVKDGCADIVTNIFAPCAEDEYMRVLKEDGVLILVGAGREHLMGLKEILYDSTYENKERADLPRYAELVERVTKKYEIELKTHKDIEDLFSMTPYYWRTSESDKDKLDNTESLKTIVEFEIYVYRNKRHRKALK